VGGRLAAAEDYRAEGWRPERQAGFPPLVFLQLLFGRRGLDELRHVLRMSGPTTRGGH